MISLVPSFSLPLLFPLFHAFSRDSLSLLSFTLISNLFFPSPFLLLFIPHFYPPKLFPYFLDSKLFLKRIHLLILSFNFSTFYSSSYYTFQIRTSITSYLYIFKDKKRIFALILSFFHPNSSILNREREKETKFFQLIRVNGGERYYQNISIGIFFQNRNGETKYI